MRQGHDLQVVVLQPIDQKEGKVAQRDTPDLAASPSY
jgi:hypothetical protein